MPGEDRRRSSGGRDPRASVVREEIILAPSLVEDRRTGFLCVPSKVGRGSLPSPDSASSGEDRGAVPPYGSTTSMVVTWASSSIYPPTTAMG